MPRGARHQLDVEPLKVDVARHGLTHLMRRELAPCATAMGPWLIAAREPKGPPAFRQSVRTPVHRFMRSAMKMANGFTPTRSPCTGWLWRTDR